MLDHINLPVSDLEKSVEFYTAILKPLGVPFLMFDADAAGFGRNHWEFGVWRESQKFVGNHVAFAAESSNAVDEFYKAAIGFGAKDNGAPGLRPEYGNSYYAAYIIDPDGHNIEAVSR